MVKYRPITEPMIIMLKRFGNLYVKKIENIDIEKLQTIVGFELKYRQCDDGDGYILERK